MQHFRKADIRSVFDFKFNLYDISTYVVLAEEGKVRFFDTQGNLQLYEKDAIAMTLENVKRYTPHQHKTIAMLSSAVVSLKHAMDLVKSKETPKIIIDSDSPSL